MINKNPSGENHQKVRDAIARTVVLSPDPAHIRKRLFQLAREVKTIVGFGKPIDDSFKCIVANWKGCSTKSQTSAFNCGCAKADPSCAS